MTESKNEKTLIIGLGNLFRRDDGAGLETVRALKRILLSKVDFLEKSGEGADLMESWKGYGRALIFDALEPPPSKKAGAFHRFQPGLQPLPSSPSSSSHLFSLVQAIELARILKRLPGEMILYGIEGVDFRHGTGLSAEVKEGIRQWTELFQGSSSKQEHLLEAIFSPARKWILYRLDDNGNEVEMALFDDPIEGEKERRAYEEKGHKQAYLLKASSSQ